MHRGIGFIEVSVECLDGKFEGGLRLPTFCIVRRRTTSAADASKHGAFISYHQSR